MEIRELSNGKTFKVIRTGMPQVREVARISDLGTDVRECDWEGGIAVHDAVSDAFITNCATEEDLEIFLKLVGR